MNWNALVRLGGAMALGLGTVEVTPALASPMPPEAPLDPAPGQTLVMPFSDVPVDHWAYQALLNLAGVYGCVSGYPDGTFRGDAALTRYEFAAGMEACLSVLMGLVQQQQNEEDQAVGDLIESMERSLEELRQIDGTLPESP